MAAKPNKKISRASAAPWPDGDALDSASAGLALALPSHVPPPRVKETLLARIRARPVAAAGEAPAGWRFASAASPEGWRATKLPGVRLKSLSVDERRDVVMLLMEMAPGATFPDHAHDAGAEEGLVLSGDVVTAGRLFQAGDYYHAAEGTRQGATVSPSGCTALLTVTTRAWKEWRAALV